jgi:hypothetical protein
MNDKAESAATRLWRDRVQLREQERDEALVQARMAKEKVANLTAENARLWALVERLEADIARLRAQLTPDPTSARAQTEQEMGELRSELLSLLEPTNEKQP